MGKALGRYFGSISPFLVSRSTRASIVGIVKTFVLVLVLVQDQSDSVFGFIPQ
jgi:hypothetical protein